MISRVVRPSARRSRHLAGAFIAGHAGEHDPPERMVRLAVAAGVEPEALVGLARRHGEGCDATQIRERSFVLQSMRVVAGSDQQDGSGVGADAVDLERHGARATHQSVECVIQSLRVGVEGKDSIVQASRSPASSRT